MYVIVELIWGFEEFFSHMVWPSNVQCRAVKEMWYSDFNTTNIYPKV